MVFYKLDKYDKYFVAFILVILVILNIGSCFAVEEEETVDLTAVNGIYVSTASNVFLSNGGQTTMYAPLEEGYLYTLHNDGQYSRNLAFCNDVPALNVEYELIAIIEPGATFTFRGNSGYLIFAFSNFNDTYVTRTKIPGQETAINDLVSNVGPQQLWSVFESGIDFIGVVVLVAFGIFLIVLLIKKLSKGKSDF